MSRKANLSDEQWVILLLLMRARQKGQPYVTRQELMNSPVPQDVMLRLTFAALTIPDELVEWRSHNVCYITEAGVALCAERMGKSGALTPDQIKQADAIICLPDMSRP